MHRNHLRPLTADFNSGHDLGRVNFRGKNPFHPTRMRSRCTTMRHYNRPLEGNRRNVAGSFQFVQWNIRLRREGRVGINRSRGSRVNEAIVSIWKKGEPAQVLLVMGHVKPQGRVPCNPFSGCPGGSHARRLPTRSVFCRFSDANLLAFFALLRVFHFIACDVFFF